MIQGPKNEGRNWNQMVHARRKSKGGMPDGYSSLFAADIETIR